MAEPVLYQFSADQVSHIRAANDRRFRGWTAKRIVALHWKTVTEASSPEVASEYIDQIRAHLASGVYRRIYPPHVVEATRLFLAQVKSAAARG